MARIPNTEINKKNKRCSTCIYGCKVDGCYTCDYIGMVRKRRGCPGGEKCTKYEKKKRKRRVSPLEYV